MLTAEQLLLVKNAILADNALNAQPQTPDGAYAIADALNQDASPAFIVWKTRVSKDEIMQNGFDWVQVDNLTVGKARIWDWLFDNTTNSCNPSKINVRAGVDECWKGTAAMLAVRTAVYIHFKRSATRAEQILATGTGTDAVPATMTYEGRVTYQDILQARAS
jgi:hypothetical protein